MNPKKPIGAEKDVVRDLMLALEYLRYACEHSEGKRKIDRDRLTRAMSVGSRITSRHAHLISDYQRGSYWEEMWEMPASVGLSKLPEIPTKQKHD